MDEYFILSRNNFDAFVSKLTQSRTVVAPVARGYNNYAFDEVTRGSQISLHYIPTILPPKKYFMPQCEIIQKFDKKAQKWEPVLESRALVIFGVHTCDLSGIQYLNDVMTRQPKDANYVARRKGITLIGFECNDYCDSYASCAVMGNHLPKGGYDLFLTELSDYYLTHLATEEGRKLVDETNLFSKAENRHLEQLKALRKNKEQVFRSEVNVDHDGLKPLFERSFDSKVWDEINGRCLACGNCTNVCPTCYCFDIRDELNLDFNTGVRCRIWDGCQNEEFAKVAGGENFRKTRGERQRHRYMRKFNYPVDRVGRYACTGCGRCSRTCMAKISLKETINALAEESARKQDDTRVAH